MQVHICVHWFYCRGLKSFQYVKTASFQARQRLKWYEHGQRQLLGRGMSFNSGSLDTLVSVVAAKSIDVSWNSAKNGKWWLCRNRVPGWVLRQTKKLLSRKQITTKILETSRMCAWDAYLSSNHHFWFLQSQMHRFTKCWQSCQLWAQEEGQCHNLHCQRKGCYQIMTATEI